MQKFLLIEELGRIAKTIHALIYIDDLTKRRRILRQLNKGETVINWLEPFLNISTS